MVATKPGWSGTVEPYSSMTAGPSTVSPGASPLRWRIGVSTYPSLGVEAHRPGRVVRLTCRF